MSNQPDQGVELIVALDGTVRGIYDERFGLGPLGTQSIRRGSHVEPTPQGQWTADLSPCGGPTLGPFPCRSEALAAEVSWLKSHWLIDPVRWDPASEPQLPLPAPEESAVGQRETGQSEAIPPETLYHVYRINWDTDDLNPAELVLPSEVLIQGDPDEFADLLSDQYHWCVMGMEFEPVPAGLNAQQLRRFEQLPLVREGR